MVICVCLDGKAGLGMEPGIPRKQGRVVPSGKGVPATASKAAETVCPWHHIGMTKTPRAVLLSHHVWPRRFSPQLQGRAEHGHCVSRKGQVCGKAASCAQLFNVHEFRVGALNQK